MFLAKTLQVEEKWLIGISDMESDTAISANKNRDLLDKNDTSNTIQTTSAEIISRDISNKEERTMHEFKKSSKLDNVLYDVRGPVVDEAARMEEAGTHVLKLNIGNPAPFGFRTPDEVIYDMRQQLTDCEGYSNAMGLFSARKAIMQYAR